MKLNEDFTSLYKRWNGGKKRKEDGTEVKTPLGNILLKNPSCNYEAIIKTILNNANSDYYMGVVINNIQIYSTDEIKNIRKGLDYSILIDNGGHGMDLVAEFEPYELTDDDGIMDNVCEDDYKSICKLIGKYLDDNVDLQKPQGYQEEYVLYLGDTNGANDDYINDFKEEFDNNFSTDSNLRFWSYQYESSIGIELSYYNVLHYSEMEEFTESWFSNYEPDDDE